MLGLGRRATFCLVQIRALLSEEPEGLAKLGDRVLNARTACWCTGCCQLNRGSRNRGIICAAVIPALAIGLNRHKFVFEYIRNKKVFRCSKRLHPVYPVLGEAAGEMEESCSIRCLRWPGILRLCARLRVFESPPTLKDPEDF